jgi:hypothetical protein
MVGLGVIVAVAVMVGVGVMVAVCEDVGVVDAVRLGVRVGGVVAVAVTVAVAVAAAVAVRVDEGANTANGEQPETKPIESTRIEPIKVFKGTIKDSLSEKGAFRLPSGINEQWITR